MTCGYESKPRGRSSLSCTGFWDWRSTVEKMDKRERRKEKYDEEKKKYTRTHWFCLSASPIVWESPACVIVKYLKKISLSLFHFSLSLFLPPPLSLSHTHTHQEKSLSWVWIVYIISLEAKSCNCICKWMVVKPFCLSTDKIYSAERGVWTCYADSWA